MKTYKLVTTCILSEYYVGLITGIVLSIAGNCTVYATSGYELKFNNHNVFVFIADEKTKEEVKKAVDFHFDDFDDPYVIIESKGEVY